MKLWLLTKQIKIGLVGFLLIVFIGTSLLGMGISYLGLADPIQERIQGDLREVGLLQVVYYYIIKAPLLEEWQFRSYALVFALIFSGSSTKLWRRLFLNLIYWSIVIWPTYLWAFQHPYPPFYQWIIFLGGLFNGLMIAHFNYLGGFSNRWKSLVAPVLAHAEVNSIIVGWIILRGC